MSVEAAYGEYTPLWLLPIGKESTLGLSSEVSEYSLFESVLLRDSRLINRDLHPAGCKDAGLCVIVGVSSAFKGLSAVHGAWGEGDPALVLRNNCDHTGLVHISNLNLVPGVLHKSQVVRDLSLVSGFLDGILGEYLM